MDNFFGTAPFVGVIEHEIKLAEGWWSGVGVGGGGQGVGVVTHCACPHGL